MSIDKHKIKKLLAHLGILLPAFRTYEYLKSFRTSGARIGEDGLLLPPNHLMVLVAGSSDSNWFVNIGREGAKSIEAILNKNGLSLSTFKKVLDFGCGCGRVIRFWKKLSGVEIFGTDYNQKLVTWCSHNLPFAKFNINQLTPPLSYPANYFDFIYTLSVFTHLPEKEQLLWLRELQRVLRPGGYLLITTQGDYYLDKLDSAEKEKFQRGELVVKYKDAAGSNLCSAYHPYKYIQNNFTDGFDVVDFIKEGAKGNPYQDAVLLKKI